MINWISNYRGIYSFICFEYEQVLPLNKKGDL